MRKGTLWKEKLLEGLSWKKLIFILLGAAIATFGIHNIHQQVGITEGGVIGAMLLVEHWLGFSPAYITPVLDVACYLLAFKYLGGSLYPHLRAVHSVRVPVLQALGTVPAYAAGPVRSSPGSGRAGRIVRGCGCGTYCAAGRLFRRG